MVDWPAGYRLGRTGQDDRLPSGQARDGMASASSFAAIFDAAVRSAELHILMTWRAGMFIMMVTVSRGHARGLDGAGTVIAQPARHRRPRRSIARTASLCTMKMGLPMPALRLR